MLRIPTHCEKRCITVLIMQGRRDGGISVYIPPNQSTLIFFMWLFCHDFEIAMTS